MQDVTPPLVLFARKLWRGYIHLLARLARNTTFKHWYAFGCLLVLMGSVVFWAMLGARLQLHNADQLSDPYMFSTRAVFSGALFPGSHTFLLKWPLFWLLNVIGVTSINLVAMTVVTVLVTVIILIYILWRIDRRPLVFGTTCLALALALLMVPAQSYAGALLPVNMAMLTTRNLEYVFYMVSVIYFARAYNVKSRSFVLGVLLLTLLIASDKLFLPLSIGGAILLLVLYALRANRPMMLFATRWLIGGVTALVLATILLLGLHALHLTGFANEVAATPYSFEASPKSLFLGSSYAVLGLFTNLGANPAYDNIELAKLPGELLSRMWGVNGFIYVLTIGTALYAIYLFGALTLGTFRKGARTARRPIAEQLALALGASTVVAGVSYVFTKHYFPVDARYLTIGFFALAVGASAQLRHHHWHWPEDLLLIAGTILIGICLAVPSVLHRSHEQNAAFNTIEQRNDAVYTALKRHDSNLLVGDYWRVLPIKLRSQGRITALPLGNCTQPTTSLTSTVWQPDLRNRPFAYLVTLDDSSLTDFPSCGLTEITHHFGRPTSAQIIAGTKTKPAEALLFYDNGAHPTKVSDSSSSVEQQLPISVSELTNTTCDQGTVLNIVAHQDDDLLFLSPDLLHDIHSGKCVRTVFLTAGDSGYGRAYWLSRQQGSEKAYDYMYDTTYNWARQSVALAPGQYVTIATPSGNPHVSLVFFNLPDGDIHGNGFAASRYQSLSQLLNNKISTIDSVDGLSVYGSSSLVSALKLLMQTYQPNEVHTQADVPSDTYPDHSDHIATGKIADAAALAYEGASGATPQIIRYIGYPIHGYEANVFNTDFDEKQAAFLTYAQYDGGVCHTIFECTETPTYGSYISRQYSDND